MAFGNFLNFLLRKIYQLLPRLFGLAVCAVVFAGWRMRRFHLIDAESGLGYALGIVGLSMTAVLFIYPLRKRISALRFLGSVKAWFRIHMFLGIMGPVLILFHANFQLGSLNSNVALFSMLIVSLSGVVGRYIYTRIHYGLYGHHATLKGLQQDLESQKDEFSPQFALIPGVKEKLFSFAEEAMKPSKTLAESFGKVLGAGWSVRVVKWEIEKVTKAYLSGYAWKHHWSLWRKYRMRRQIRRKTRRFIVQTQKVAEFTFYERLFSLWHVLHLPLAFLMVLTSVVHVVAVHLY